MLSPKNKINSKKINKNQPHNVLLYFKKMDKIFLNIEHHNFLKYLHKAEEATFLWFFYNLAILLLWRGWSCGIIRVTLPQCAIPTLLLSLLKAGASLPCMPFLAQTQYDRQQCSGKSGNWARQKKYNQLWERKVGKGSTTYNWLMVFLPSSSLCMASWAIIKWKCRILCSKLIKNFKAYYGTSL